MLSTRRINLTGQTTDRECSPEGRIIRRQRRLARVEVSLATPVGKQCRFLTSAGRLSAPRSCASPLFVAAQTVSFDAKKAKTTWRLARRASLRRGRYSAVVRGIDQDGNVEQAKRRSNRASFQLR